MHFVGFGGLAPTLAPFPKLIMSDNGSLSSAGSSLEDPRPRKKRMLNRKSKYWFLTWNSFPVDWKSHFLALRNLQKYCVQVETAEVEHLQGVLVFDRKLSFSELHDACPGCHWEVCRDLKACVKYCSKFKTRTGEQWIKGFKTPLVVRDPLEGKELYEFQKDIIHILGNEPDERTIYWFWSNKGNIGKSSLCKHLCLKYGAISLGGKVSDAMYAVAKMVEAGKPPKVIIFDVARSEAKYLKYVSLELLKNGCFFSGKYESGQVLMNPPHIIVFANEKPDQSKLSADRWEIKCLDYDLDLPGFSTLGVVF